MKSGGCPCCCRQNSTISCWCKSKSGAKICTENQSRSILQLETMAGSDLARKGREQGGHHPLVHKDRTRKRSEEPSNPPPSPPLSLFKYFPFYIPTEGSVSFLSVDFFSSILCFPFPFSLPYSSMFFVFLSLSSFFSLPDSSSSSPLMEIMQSRSLFFLFSFFGYLLFLRCKKETTGRTISDRKEEKRLKRKVVYKI